MKDDRTSQAGKPGGAQARCGANPTHRILVVDDDADIRQSWTEVLIYSGYYVDAAEDGAVAWDTLQLKSYDLLVTDYNMPKVSGVELVKKLRSASMALPVILASGTIPMDELNRHPWLQLAAPLLKPFTGDELVDTVKKVLHPTDGAREQLDPLPIWRSQPSADGLWLK